MSSIEEIKARIDIVDLVSETVKLRRSGKNYTGFCPFHENTRTPAFVVFSDSGTWRCFGQCNEGGDIFKFVMKKEGCDFGEALRLLAERAGVQLKPLTPQDEARTEEHERLRELLESAVTFYRHQLHNTSQGQSALRYLIEKRNLTPETIERFGLGYAPDAWEDTMRYLLGRGFTSDDLIAAGMVTQRDDGRIYDRFRNRITIPIRDERGRMCGFGARILDPNDIPKFLNSPQTELFDKGRLLYGLDLARKAIRQQEEAVIVEGYLDVIAVHQAGFDNVVSPMGTALSEHHLHSLKRLARRIVLALDPDAAGDKATLRGLQMARDTLERSDDPVFNARGLIGFGARLQADIRVAVLPDGLDPDELVARAPQEWADLMRDARPVVLHVMETLAAGQNLDDPAVKTEIAARVLPLIEDLPNPIERETYRQRLARLLQVDERALFSRPTAPPRYRPPDRREAPDEAPPPTPAEVITLTYAAAQLRSAYVLSALLRWPDLLFRIDRGLQSSQLGRLSAADFSTSAYQRLFHIITESVNQDAIEPEVYLLDHIDGLLHETVDELLKDERNALPESFSSPDRLVEELLRIILTTRREDLLQRIEHRQFQIQEAQESDDRQAVTEHLQHQVADNAILQKIDRASKQLTRQASASLSAK
ncbi:MAG: DNA primase [Anaerolineales bacterium]